MSEKAKIILKKDFKNKREVSVGSKTIHAVPGKPVEIELKDLDIWLKTGRFERFDEPKEPVSDLPAETPGRSALIKNNVNTDKLLTMDKAALVELPGIADKTADEILKFLETNAGGQQ